ncbi:ribbon-helix-helix domain-containing protein [Candidatus Poriferisocius sp.]|uniref:ribbon-helix-helix domain-containing protein n=1 Tax=Candidatus Poriferisocius sp. TaxID=3101276 RepID=UPI003B516CF6
MPNRTIYLPEDLDEVSRRVGINLSRLAQQAIRDFIAEHHESALEARIEAVMDRSRGLGIVWPKDHLGAQRSEAGER